ncbi:tetratricopeptide repeat protein [Paracraurococcus lichenis]|uniref:Tetratricopeptide repeat protein n=1 Tax=Paracraurococcus lichenis TaxID=3064888 RepID=A0ABT9E6V7_9PROT|nr:tetratricopeptide repeat protein [Paracraurococcus sp. LOR1-02]MDO9711917.1 tetratricopeptide repeat protein [Paracraurococcus sp. LOR1-02]
MRCLFVSARNSSFVYKGRPVDMRQVGRELVIRYALEGSVRRSADRIRITGQLVDATTGGHLWADRFEGALDDVFTLQDQMAASVVGAIAPQLERAEIERSRRKPTGSLDAYDYHLRGTARVHQGTREGIEATLPVFDAAMRLDPDYAAAYGMAAWCLFWRKVNAWTADRGQELARGARLARRAVKLGKDHDAVALTRGAHALAHFPGDLDGAIAWVDRALVLDPNHAPAWFIGGFLRLWRGEPDAAIERFDRAMRLSPLDSEMHRKQAGTAMAHLLAERFDEASSWAERAVREHPDFLMAVGIGALASLATTWLAQSS